MGKPSSPSPPAVVLFLRDLPHDNQEKRCLSKSRNTLLVQHPDFQTRHQCAGGRLHVIWELTWWSCRCRPCGMLATKLGARLGPRFLHPLCLDRVCTEPRCFKMEI